MFPRQAPTYPPKNLYIIADRARFGKPDLSPFVGVATFADSLFTRVLSVILPRPADARFFTARAAELLLAEPRLVRPGCSARL